MSDAPEQLVIPRWAKDLGPDKWLRINDLLLDGYSSSEIADTLDLPGNKLRSLQVYAAKFGPRRRLKQFEAFKDALATGGADLAGDFAKALKLIAERAVSDKIDPRTQQRAAELLVKFTEKLTGLMSQDLDTEKERRKEEAAKQEAVSPHELVRRVMEVYGGPTGKA